MTDDISRIENKLRGFIIEKFEWERPPDDIVNFDLIGGGFLDSIGVSEIGFFVENEFSVSILDDGVPENFDTIAHIARVVASKQASRR